MNFEIVESPIDLIECGRKFKGKVATDSFGLTIIKLAEAVIRRHQRREELNGIRMCLIYLLGTLRWNEGFRLFRSTCKLTAPTRIPKFYLLADSIIATTLIYRVDLSESNTGLGTIILAEFIQGFECACSASERIGGQNLVANAPLISSAVVSSYIE